LFSVAAGSIQLNRESGGVVMNSMVMELPDGQEGRCWPFALGAIGYAALLVIALL